MRTTWAEDLIGTASGVLGGADLALLRELLAFLEQRLQGAAGECAVIGTLAAGEAKAGRAQAALHRFLRDSWDALDALGRVANVCLYERFPDSRLWPPGSMTRQCTFYTVRRALHSHPAAAGHPVSRLLWDETRSAPPEAYVRLSLLRNLSVFALVPLPEGQMLPGSGDIPPHLAALVKGYPVGRCELVQGCSEMLRWLGGFVARCCGGLATALTAGGGGGSFSL